MDEPASGLRPDDEDGRSPPRLRAGGRLRRQRNATLELLTTRGWESRALLAETLEIDRLEALLAPGREHAGCWLLRAQELFSPR